MFDSNHRAACSAAEDRGLLDLVDFCQFLTRMLTRMVLDKSMGECGSICLQV